MGVEAGPIVQRGEVQRVLIETQATSERCAKCGRPIQPGQLYVRRPVRHLGCRP